jgi:hypothetical protein
LGELIERKKSVIKSDANKKTCTDVDTQLEERLKTVLDYSQSLIVDYERWFDKIKMYQQVKSVFEEKGLRLRLLAQDIIFLSLNASVASYKILQGGETFGVLSSDIRINAKENDRLIGHIHTLSQSLADALNIFIFTISAIRIQIEMVNSFVGESLKCNAQSSVSELGENLDSLITLVSAYSEKLGGLQLKMDSIIQESLSHLDELEQQVMYLGYIQVYGMIEAASIEDERIDFGGIFSQLKVLIQSTSEDIVTIQKMGANFHAENRNLMEAAKKIGIIVNQFRLEVDVIKTMDVHNEE